MAYYTKLVMDGLVLGLLQVSLLSVAYYDTFGMNQGYTSYFYYSFTRMRIWSTIIQSSLDIRQLYILEIALLLITSLPT